jgi:hypothetical protein
LGELGEVTLYLLYLKGLLLPQIKIKWGKFPQNWGSNRRYKINKGAIKNPFYAWYSLKMGEI